MPLYKHQQFERSIKKWLTDSLQWHETEFKIALQLSEREIMSSFAFKKELRDSKAHSTLNEAITVDENNVLISYNTEFEGENLESLKSNMRKITPEYKSDTKFMKDTQIVVDENYYNWQFFTLFSDNNLFSLTEELFNNWPEVIPGGAQIIRVLMSTQVWGFFFPHLR